MAFNPIQYFKDHKLQSFGAMYGFFSFIAVIIFLGSASGWIPVLIGAGLALLPMPFYVYLVLRADPSREPITNLIMAFVWGMAAGAILSLIFNTVIGVFVGDLVGRMIIAPIIEEVFKGIGVFGIFFLAKSSIDNARDGIVYGSLTGLGFAMTENILYYLNAFVSGGMSGAWKVFALRAFGGYAHAVFTSITAIGFVLASRQKNPIMQKVIGFGGLFLAIVMHIAWNSAAILGNGGFWLMWAVVYLPSMLFIFNYKFKEN